MTEPYSKLTNIQPLSQQTLESLERFQQQMTNAIEPYKKIANMMSSYTEKISEISNTLSPGITQLIEMQQRYNEMMQPIVENLNIRIQPLNLAFESIVNTLNNLNISENPTILQEPAFNFFEPEILEEFSSSIQLLQVEGSDLFINEEVENICNQPIKKLTIANIYSILGIYLTIISVITGTKELYDLFAGNDTYPIVEYNNNATEQNTIDIETLNINFNLCPSLSSEQNDNELNSNKEITDNAINE